MKKPDKKSFVETIATFIVDKRKAFYFIYIGLAIFCAFSSNWVKVNNDITTYLPEETETRQALNIMDKEFTTFGSDSIMIDNISYEKAEKIADQIRNISGVKSVAFDDTLEHYTKASAMLSVTFDGDAESDVSLDAFHKVKDALSDFDTYIMGDVGSSTSESIANEMKIVMVVAVVIILLVLLFTSHTYMEIPVLLMTFGMAALLNMGTNFFFGTISFVSNSIAVVLQLALAIDYAIILCHRFTEEREHLDAREAAIEALSKAIPEISGSSLTTLSGLAAMTFMQFRIGFDMGIVLMKAIVLSLLCVFTLMPGLLMSLSPLIDKTHHRNFVPKIAFLGKFDVKTRFIIPPIFLALLVSAFIFSNNCPYVYGYSTLSTVSKNESQIAEEKIKSTFKTTNMVAMMVPSGNYEKERQLLNEISKLDKVDSVLGLATVEAMDGYMVTDKLTPRQFAELTNLDIEVSRLIYSAYAVDDENYGQLVGGIDRYSVPLIDMFLFVYEQVSDGYVNLDAELNNTLSDLNSQLTDGKLQLEGENYSRFVIQLDLPEESSETFEYMNLLHKTAAKYYPQDVYITGQTTSDMDLSSSFVNDNLLISILTLVFVIIVLLFQFQSAGLPVLLIMVIQGSVWINFSFPYLTDTNIFFLSYLIVSSIQMGANIDYAIVITNRYTQLKKEMPLHEAIVETLNQSFPTIITSGSILASAGILIGQLSSDPAISSIGVCLGRGTIISIILVMCVMPQILLLGDIIIEKTSFTLKKPKVSLNLDGLTRVDGRLRGYIEGNIDAEVRGLVNGKLNCTLETGKTEKEEEVGLDEKDN